MGWRGGRRPASGSNISEEFPLPRHNWSITAAVANECAYQINPAAFSGYRTLIFVNQNGINASSEVA
jgi:hypothetical protein